MLVTEKFNVIQTGYHFNFGLSLSVYIVLVNLSGCYVEIHS